MAAPIIRAGQARRPTASEPFTTSNYSSPAASSLSTHATISNSKPRIIWVVNLNLTSPGTLKKTYTGETLDGEIPHGRGIYTCVDISSYFGQFKKGIKDGYGTYTGADGSSYAGEYKDGKRHGLGSSTKADRSSYVGQFYNNKGNGLGIYTWADGSSQVGYFIGGKRHGLGIYTWADGSSQVGYLKDDKWHGFAIRTKKKDEKILTLKAMWENNKPIQNAAKPNDFEQKIKDMKVEINEIKILCEEAKDGIKEVYLKCIREPIIFHFPKVKIFTIHDLNHIIAEYAAPDWIGDGKGWKIETVEKVKKGFFAKLFSWRPSSTPSSSSAATTSPSQAISQEN